MRRAPGWASVKGAWPRRWTAPPQTAGPPPRARRVTAADTIARFTALADKHGLVFGPSCDG
jgi:hypothetical protein